MSIKKVKSGIIMFLIVSASLLVIFPLEMPRTVNAISHGGAGSPGPYAAAEDGVIPWDMDGEVNGIVVWSDIENPHVIENFDYIVNESYTLFIAPGCEVRFNAGLSLVLESGINPAELRADGEGMGITFTSNAGGNPGDWGCIHAGFGTLIHTLSNCVVEYSTDGVYVDNGALGNPLEDCEFRYNSNFGLYLNASTGIVDVNNNYFYNNTRGIYLKDQMGGPMVSNNHIYNCDFGVSSISSSLQLQNNEIYSNDYGVVLNLSTFSVSPSIILNNISDNSIDGILVQGETPSIDRNEISNNGRHGINATPDPISGARPLINVMGNDITSNSEHGIYSFNSSNVWIDSNFIYNNSKDGVYILCDSGPTATIDISNNDILNNGIHGITLIGEEPTIDNNNISYNGEDGIHICDDPSFGPTSPLIQGNKLENNTDAGISIDGINPNINNNTILNTSFGIFVEQNANPQIENCRIENHPVFNTGIEIRDSSGNITNVTILDGKCGIYSLNSDFSVYRSRIENWTKDGVVATSGSSIWMENTTMSSSLGSSIYINGNSHITTLNSTFDKLDVNIDDPPSNITVMWWVHLKVNESDGDPAIGAQVWLNNTFGDIVNSSTTNSDGRINWVQATEYVEGFGAVDYNIHVATAVNNSITGVTYSEIDGYRIIYVDLGIVRDFPIQLKTGWNMISIPLIPFDPVIDKILERIDGKYKTVECYNVSDLADQWKIYDVDKSFGNDLLVINYTNGIWIYMNMNETMYITGERLVTTDIPMQKGWNYVGYPSLTSRLLADALSSISGEYDAVYHYDTNDILDPWENNNDGDLTEMKPGKGYWIYILQDCIWTIGG